MSIFEKLESNVRSYCRSFPVVFDRAKGDLLYSEDGRAYIDFFAGAGALNYGHNNDYIKGRVLDYLTSDRIMHGLDMYTMAKREFIQSFSERILEPKKLNYKLQFCGPTGTNAVEAALKLARKAKKRTGIFAFMGGFHGMSLGYIENILTDSHSGIDKPAAILLETVQAEGGIHVADAQWLRGLQQLCRRHDILLITDEIQVGCGRTGEFFSFERAGIEPDLITLSKSISGYGLPMSLLLLKPELDLWTPGEHNGTFRGNQLAFVAAKAALEFRDRAALDAEVKKKEEFVRSFLDKEIKPLHPSIAIRGLGLIWGIDVSGFTDEAGAKRMTEISFKNGLIIERAGRGDHVLKIMPPLTVSMEHLAAGCDIIKSSIQQVISQETQDLLVTT
ncbi:aminotransferase class III-fold pyridoxal phosphate-dependent enzyme [Paenibacillus alvei]|uniref:aminotransferase class III-fold pyridoxal phosphate-dependent enzyme n=1 Tax=Paenibacillus alvei TaxID=44250 RepID=UPI0002885D58|nr:aminotransferase class III-fold pyridoxal phosphate-dependent enzyme [Paenibacillus alvei]EJW20319.1 diaminobutyrate--2-oxoglutarate transaminase EctB [Paenibacillus alvei DSM 29]MCY9540246.1 aminotransferase class III-fold pyridoxal phosphate-dependent enzyme [Paenibacillus alvei]MCY9705769.1 aminotransferase class III-fold pyridoxal phosphate-dependent enzyme [Paenibacillus alvei]MEC0083656.1 aminotransferase class III-fold pyridoxal phosphate-dependent enzyme [Paenibacillus alvei]